MNTKRLAGVILSIIFIGTSIAGNIALAQEYRPCSFVKTENGRLRLENQYVLLEIDPNSGGRGNRLVCKSSQGDLCYFGPDDGNIYGGLFGDRLVEHGAISFNTVVAPYSFEVKKKTAEEVSLLLYYKGGDNIQFEKLITLRRDSSSIEIVRSMGYMVADPSAPKKKVGFWSHQSLRTGIANGQQAYKNTFFVPTERGILEIPFVPGETTSAPGTKNGYIEDPSRGWIATVGGKTQADSYGAAYELDFSSLEKFYVYMGTSNPNCPTMEWQHFVRGMKDGDRLDVVTRLIPFHGIKQVSGVGNGMVGEILFKKDRYEKGSKVPIKVSLYSDANRKIQLLIFIHRFPEGRKEKKLERSLSLKIDKTISIGSSFLPGNSGTYVITVQAQGKDGKVIMEMEKPLVVGSASSEYVMEPASRDVPLKTQYVRKPLTGPKSPHEKWLKPLSGKKPHVLFFISPQRLRFLFELTQRMDFTYDYVFYEKGKLLKKDFLLLRGAGIDRDEEVLLREYLENPELDCIFGPELTRLPDDIRKRIAKRINEGVGRVIFPFSRKELTFLRKKDGKFGVISDSVREHFSPQNTWDLTETFPYKASKEDFQTLVEYKGEPLVIGSCFGKGRIIGLTAKSSRPFEMMYTRDWESDEYFYLKTYQEFPDYEYSYMLTLRMISWASKKDPVVRIKALDGPDETIQKGTTAAIRLIVENFSSQPQEATVQWDLKDPFYRTVANNEVPSFRISGGQKKDMSLSMPQDLIHGQHIIHVFLRNRNGKVFDSYAVSFFVKSPVQVKDVVIENRRCFSGEKVKGAVHLWTEASDKHSVTIMQELITPSKRIIYQSKRKVSLKPGDSEVAFSHTVPETKALILDLRTRIVEKNEVLAERIDYIVLGNALALDRTEMTFGTYILRSRRMGRHLSYFLNREGMEFGGIILSVNNGKAAYSGTDFNPCFNALKNNMKFIFSGAGSIIRNPGWTNLLPAKRKGTPNTWSSVKENDPHNYWRSGYFKMCYEDPRFYEIEKKIIRNYAEKISPLYQPEYLQRADEAVFQRRSYEEVRGAHGRGGNAMDDLCFCEHHLKKFRTYLQKEYGTLDALNKTWQTDFASWESVMPLAGRQVKGKDNIAPFLDFRLFMCRSFSDLTLRAKDFVEEGGLPDTKSNANIHWEGPFTCMLAFYLFGEGTKGKISPNYYPRTFTQVRSYAQEPAELIIGYDIYGYTYNKAIYYAWKNLLYGSSNITFHTGAYYLAMGCVLTPTFSHGSLYPWMKDLQVGMKETGIAKTILTAKAGRPYRVGVVESYRSMMDYSVEPERFDEQGFYKKDTNAMWQDWKKVYENYGSLLEDLGISWRLVNEEEVKQDISDDMKILIFPRVTCVSEKLWQAIRDFLARGGTVIADWRFAERDGHGKVNAYEKELSDIFGIKRIARKPESGIHMLSLKGRKVQVKGAYTGKAREKGIELAQGGQADGRYIDGVSSLIVKEHPRGGRSIYLNFTLGNYTGGDTKAQKLFSAFFKKSDVKSFVKIKDSKGQRMPGVFSRVYRRGAYTYVGFLSRNSIDDMVLRFPDKAYIYEVGGNGLIGNSDNVRLNLKAATGKLVALLPSKVKRISLQIPPAVEQGQTLCWKAVVEIESGEVGDHVLSIEVESPQREKSTSWSGNRLALEGKLVEKWKIAYNELPGKWSITVRDTISGEVAEGTFVIEEIK